MWTGGMEVTKKAMIAWDKVVMSKTSGGLNILGIIV